MILGLVGPSGAGKTEVSRYLQKRYGFTDFHAGEPVKDAVRRGFDLSKRQVDRKAKDRPALELGGVHPRRVLEQWGEALHQTAPRATAIALHQRMMPDVAKGKHIVVEGVRQPAEAQMLRRLGATLIRLDRGRPLNPAFPLDKLQAGIETDHTVKNTGTLRDLRSQVDVLLHSLDGAAA